MSEAEERRICTSEGCENSQFLDPKYLNEKMGRICAVQAERARETQQARMDEAMRRQFFENDGCYTGPCAVRRCSQLPYCTGDY